MASFPILPKFVVILVLGYGVVGIQPATAGLCVGTAKECDACSESQDEVLAGSDEILAHLIMLSDTPDCSSKPGGLDMLVYFEPDSANLSEQALVNLEEFAKALQGDQLVGARFVVEGYTNARGTERYNLGLSQRQAQAVAQFLVERGVAPEVVRAVGMGETNPRVPDPMDEVNQRVEMRIDLP